MLWPVKERALHSARAGEAGDRDLKARYRLGREIGHLQLDSDLQAARLEQRNWIVAGVKVAFTMAALAALMACP